MPFWSNLLINQTSACINYAQYISTGKLSGSCNFLMYILINIHLYIEIHTYVFVLKSMMLCFFTDNQEIRPSLCFAEVSFSSFGIGIWKECVLGTNHF